jgi:hypothetical protein
MGLCRYRQRDRATIETLLDTEYSVAFREPDGRTVVRHSTLPWLEGTTLDVAV